MLITAHISFLDLIKICTPIFLGIKMKNKSVNHAIMKLSKEIEMQASEGEYEIFSGVDELNLELLACREYLAEKIEGFYSEDAYQN